MAAPTTFTHVAQDALLAAAPATTLTCIVALATHVAAVAATATTIEDNSGSDGSTAYLHEVAIRLTDVAFAPKKIMGGSVAYADVGGSGIIRT